MYFSTVIYRNVKYVNMVFGSIPSSLTTTILYDSLYKLNSFSRTYKSLSRDLLVSYTDLLPNLL